MKKKLLLSLAGLLSIVTLASCSETSSIGTSSSTPDTSHTTQPTTPSTSTPTVDIDSITLVNQEEIEKPMQNGTDRTLNITTDPEQNVYTLISSGAMKITSSDTSVLTVMGQVVHAAGLGEATITITCGDVSLTTAPIGVYANVSIIPESDTIVVGQTQALQLESLDGSTVVTDYNWTSSDETLATVDENGVVTGIAASDSKVTITATAKDSEITSCSFDFFVATEDKTTTLDTLAKGQEAVVDAIVVAKNARSVLIYDGTATAMYYLNAKPTDYEIGDHLRIRETISGAYSGFNQFTAAAVVTKLQATDEITAPEATPLTADVAEAWVGKTSFAQTELKKYSYSTIAGELGGYTTLSLAGANVTIEPSYLDSDMFTFEKNTAYDIEGFFVGYSSSNAYAALLITSVEPREVTEDEILLNVTETSGYTSSTLTISAAYAGTSEGALTWSSSDDTLATVTPAVDSEGNPTGEATVSLLAQGEVTITATYGTATATCVIDILTAVGEPELQFVDLATVINADDTDGKFIYITEGIATDVKGDQYGNMYLEDDAGNSIQVYGSGASADAIVFDNATERYSYENAKDFNTNEYTMGIKDGDRLTVAAIRADYGSTKEISAVILAVNGETIVNGSRTTDDFNNETVKTFGVYEVSGTITSWRYSDSTDGTQYGNFYLVSEGCTDDILVYGASANGTINISDRNEGDVYYFSNPKDFLTDEKTSSLTIGSEVSMLVYYAPYNGTPQITGIVL